MSEGGLPARARRRDWRASTLIAALLVMGAGASGAETVTLTSIRDNTLFQDATGSLSNGSGPVAFAGRNNQNLLRRALVRFDVEAELPPGAVITSVTLTLNVSNVSDPVPRVFTVHRAQKDWGEGASSGTGGSGAPAETNDATWLCTFHPGSLWSNPGGDFESIASASQLLGDVGVYSWSGSRLVSDVQGWRNGVVPNHGWVIVGDETVVGTARRFDTRENAVAANRPTLTVSYSVPTGVDGEKADGVAFGPCWPNPATAAMRFRVSLLAGARVELAIHDLAGRRVATVTDRVLPAGIHDLVWAGDRAIGSGVYLATLSVEGRTVGTRRWVKVE